MTQSVPRVALTVGTPDQPESLNGAVCKAILSPSEVVRAAPILQIAYRSMSMNRCLLTHRLKKPSALIVIASMMISACSIVGVRTGTEQPPYSVVGGVGEDIELRQYQERLAAKVTLKANSENTERRNAAFSILADYIFGNNRSNAKLTMTSPVAAPILSEKIAMTAPVVTDAGTGGAYTMSFFLPRNITIENAPVPVDPRIELLVVPATKMAALRFNGARDDVRVEEFKAQLLQALTLSEWKIVGKPMAYFYDPPWTIPSLRRNEVTAFVKPINSGHGE
jgi:hypothetical protein